jgi:succinoglycan biosynthesis protein ExoA
MAATPDDDTPGVSYVMPVLNEADYLESAVASIVAQGYPGPWELILAVGPSTDGTGGILERLAAADERIRTVPNPGRDIPIGLNLAIAAARHPVIVRVDAHTQLADGYTARGVADLARTGAASLGGIMLASGKPGFQEAVARAYNSRFGLGGGAYHGEHAVDGPAESAYMGIMRADVIRSVGGYDETIRRGEDWELNYRLRQAGHVVWLDPQLRVIYWPRSTWTKLARQFVSTGTWRGELVRRLGARNPLRFFAPPALVINMVVAIVFIPLHATGVFHDWWGWVLALAYVPPVLYLGLLGVAAIRRGGNVLDWMRQALAIGTMHLSWGVGFLIGVTRGARDAVDTSRAVG